MRTVVLVALATVLLTPFASSTNGTQPNSEREVTGGHAILMEHYTATWCDSCAEIDPWITDFTDTHRGRVYRIALHPNDHDPFGTLATHQRVFMKNAGNQTPLPTIWFDGGDELQGVMTYSQVSDALLNAEYNRERGHVVKMRWNAWVADDDSSTERIEVMFDNEWPENTSLTLFKTETKVHDSEIASNGVVTHYDVVTDMFVTNLNASSPNFLLDSNTSEIWYESSTSYSQSDGFDSVIGFDIQGNADGYVAVFENQGDVLAVIGITGNANSPENSSNNTNLALFFLFGALAASSIVTYRKPQE